MATGYSLTTHYAGQGLLDSFSFFIGNDPSHGFVDYQSKEDAIAKNLVSVGRDCNNVRIGVDSNNTYSAGDKGRPSAFNNQDNETEWPLGGELEIIEGANTAQRNLYSAHTTEGCKAPSAGFTGKQGRVNCSPTGDNVGCNYAAPQSDTTSYGDAFNAEGGGVYALEWDSEDLKLWHFPRSTIPDNIVYAHVLGPDPTTWGPPQAVFGGSSCSPDEHFFNMSLVLNTNFCGDYAGNLWGKADQCNRLAPTCEQFVAENPRSFENTYWDINFIDVYQMGPLSEKTVPPLPINTTATSISSASSVTGAPTGVVPTHTRTITLSTVKPTETSSSPIDPTDIDGHTLLGCFRTHDSGNPFLPVKSGADMDNKACVAASAGHKYAGVQGDTCYCADTLGELSGVEKALCNTPCLGNGDEICGGLTSPASTRISPSHSPITNSSTPSIQTHRLPALSNVLLTVYANLFNDPAPPGAPAMGGSPPPPPPPHPSSLKLKPKPAHKDAMVTTDVTITYTTVCATNPAKLVEAEYHTTVTYAQCTCTHSQPPHPTTKPAPPPPAALAAVPMKMYKTTCRACGAHGESTVTLTVPQALYTTTTSSSPSDVVAVTTTTAVHTVIPVVGTGAVPTNGTVPAAAGVATFTPPPPPRPRPSSFAPPLVAAAPPRSETFTAVQMLGWGVAVWFTLFEIMLIL
ncbi:glycoside hydrolase family 16 protein [Daldinia caldariorum]|uniref:glycoside hydrolase family 16 protein n=1 Tax=Daldinia caldariorum TaxID=326644 RepID=UPI0020089A18|nr:glycoside hydrolase family 16 protein [Daldinia caldariorum]KAI1468697.1 glycoside hydrolase family 16 protein [Daldinia caldariorum]